MKTDKIKIKNATREELVNEINMVNEELSDRMFPVSGARSQKLIDYISEIQKELNMRDATLEEQQAIQDNIDKISKPTGVNFWDSLEGCKNKSPLKELKEIIKYAPTYYNERLNEISQVCDLYNGIVSLSNRNTADALMKIISQIAYGSLEPNHEVICKYLKEAVDDLASGMSATSVLYKYDEIYEVYYKLNIG